MTQARGRVRGLRAAAWLACAAAAGGCATAPAPDVRAARAADAAAVSDPHGSFAEFFDAHLSGEAWSENVVRDYVKTSDVAAPLVLALGALAVRPADRRISRQWSGGRGERDLHAGTRRSGDRALGALVAGSVLLGWAAPGEGRSSRDAVWNGVEALTLTFVETEIVKRAVGRSRPDRSDDLSFLSGHTSASFAAATLLDRNCGSAVGIPAYGLAAFVGFSRIRSNKHFASDVLLGAALGIFTARSIDALHFGTGREGRGICSPRAETRFEVGVDPDGTVSAGVVIRF